MSQKECRSNRCFSGKGGINIAHGDYANRGRAWTGRSPRLKARERQPAMKSFFSKPVLRALNGDRPCLTIRQTALL